MQRFFSIQIQNRVIHFGLATTKEEKDEIFRLRYDVYLRKNYIYPNDREVDFDEYDEKKNCAHCIAKVGDYIIGSARIVWGRHSFIKDYFSFPEPEKMKELSPRQKGEVGYLVVDDNFDNNIGLFPKYVILAGLMYTVLKYAQKNGLEGGYAIMNKKIEKTLKFFKVPFYEIKDFELITQKISQRKFFNLPSEKPFPVYYLTKEVKLYLDRFFNKKMFWQYLPRKNMFVFKNVALWKFLVNFARFFYP